MATVARSLSTQNDLQHFTVTQEKEDGINAFSENDKSLLNKSDLDLKKSKIPDDVKKKRKEARSRVKQRELPSKEGTKHSEATLKAVEYLPKLKTQLTKYLNENYRTTESGIQCIYLDADQPGKIMVETSPQKHSKANDVITQFLSKQYPADKPNQEVMRKYFEVKKQEVKLQYSWNSYNRITVAGQTNFCSVGCPVRNEPLPEEGWSQEPYGHLTSAHGISMEKFVSDGRLSGSILDQMNKQVALFEKAPYKSVCGPYSRQDEENTYKAVDAAVIKIQDGSQQGGQYQFETTFNGPPEKLEISIQSHERASPERQVYKIGSANGVETVGYIQTADLAENLTFQWNGQAPETFYCDNVIRIRRAAGHDLFSLQGDSGAVVYRFIKGKKQALGLISRCDQAGEGVTHAVYCSNCRDALKDFCNIEVQLAADE